MAFFILTAHDGQERSFNTETVRSIAPFDKAHRLSDIEKDLRRQYNVFDPADPLPANAQKTYDEIAEGWSTIRSEVHIGDNAWNYVRETVKEATRIANEAVRQNAPPSPSPGQSTGPISNLRSMFSGPKV